MMTKFQSRVLEMTLKIPKGKVTTYKELARSVGRPNAWRAVANALAANPHPIRIPCHRVVKSNGWLGGYTSGVKRKVDLLATEGIEIIGDKVDLSKHMFRF
jgi:methylated-DNA-[protein]-cysteine S-methyltransferase